MIQKDMPIIQVEVIVPMGAPLQGVVKSGVHMVSLSVYCKYIPGMAVAHALFRVRLAEGNDAFHPHRVAQHLHRFGDALAHAHSLGQGADDLVGIGFLQLVIADTVQYKIVDGHFLFQLTFPL